MHKLDGIIKFIKSKVDLQDNSTAIILGNDFSGFLEKLDYKQEIPFSLIPNLKALGKDKEKNKFVFGKINSNPLVVIQGRLHYSYGYEPNDIANLIFILKSLGCSRLILTASVGSINAKIRVGDIVTAVDHINLTGRNPLQKNDYLKFGHTFVDMLSPYDEHMMHSLSITAKKEMNLKIKSGVLVEFPGPSSETYSEALMASKLGADFVGFNVCSEVIACRYCTLPTILYGIVTNFGASLTANNVSHDDIVFNRKVSNTYYLDLLYRFVSNLT